MLKNFNWIQQHDLKDCGPACLAMTSRHYFHSCLYTTMVSHLN
ncbi:hypothetical protein DN390_29230 [Bacillus sp. SH7-1]|nr:hypothetical protein DN390_29230 [Bacillus sp. SH7-1]